MQDKQAFEIENKFGFAMFEESIANPKIKEALSDIGCLLYEKVLLPIKEAVAKQGINNLPIPIKESLEQFARQHSKAEPQYGCVAATYDDKGGITHKYESSAAITTNLDNVNEMLDKMEHALLNIKDIKTDSEMAKAIKTMGDMGFVFWKFLSPPPPDLRKKDENGVVIRDANGRSIKKTEAEMTDADKEALEKFRPFERINNMIWPSDPEFVTRLFRHQIGEEKQLQVDWGIGHTPGAGLSPEKAKIGRNSGRAAFARVDMAAGVEILIKNYDAAKQELESKIATAAGKNEIAALADKLEILETSMKEAGIPTDKKDRKELSFYQEKCKTMLEKLVKLPDGRSLALIASVSGSTARPFITLLYFDAFKKADGTFDFAKAQIFANCIMGYFVKSGHHSFAEVAEIYNRVLDYIAIYHPEQLPKEIVRNEKSGIPYGEYYNAVERQLPYFDFAKYETFVHQDYKKHVVNTANAMNEETYNAYVKTGKAPVQNENQMDKKQVPVMIPLQEHKVETRIRYQVAEATIYQRLQPKEQVVAPVWYQKAQTVEVPKKPDSVKSTANFFKKKPQTKPVVPQVPVSTTITIKVATHSDSKGIAALKRQLKMS